MIGARTAVALYVALALHVLAVLLIFLLPAPQLAPGSAQGLGVGLRLAGSESVLAARPPPAKAGSATPSAKPPPIVRAALQKAARARATVVGTADGLSVAPPGSGSAMDEAPLARAGLPGAASAAESAGGGGADSYFARLRQHLHRFRRDLPLDASAGRAEVAMVIEADGRVSSLGLERRSLSVLLDEEAIALVRRAEPLPRPPGGSALRVVVPVLIDRE